jgi:GT2 family glycosyltransferase/glycosyltransferase involved in cell wall biosynthesis
MTPAKLVSIIILNYNGREHLQRCLASLQDLKFPAPQLEIIVVDNGSTDGSLGSIKAQFPEVVLIHNETNLGFSKAANIGADHAKGDYVAFLNNDMRVAENWLSVLLETSRAGKGRACAGSIVLNWDGSEVDFKGRTDDAFCLAYEPSTDESPNVSKAPPYVLSLFASGGAALFERRVFQELGGFDPDFFLYQEDVDLGWRLWLRGYECVIARASVVYHRGGASSSKLAPEYVQQLSQRNALCSIFKNLDDRNLREILPIILHALLERSRWAPAARESLETAIDEFKAELETLIVKRNEVQRNRVRSDAELFALLGHPFNFLLRQETSAPLRKLLLKSCEDIPFNPNDAGSVRSAISAWLNKAHFIYESRLANDFHSQRNQISERDEIIIARGETIGRLQDDLTARLKTHARIENEMQTKLADSEKRKADLEGKNNLLAAELSARNHELGKIKNSLGWRILSRYGRFKYQRLLPVYRALKLPPYGRRQTEPQSFDQNGGATPVADAEQLPIPLESNAFDVICFPIIDWDFRFQRPQQLMSRFAAHGHRVFYIAQTFRSSGPAYTIQPKRENVYEVSLRAPARIVYRDVLDQEACDALFGSLDSLRCDLSLGATAAFAQLPFWWPIVKRARAKFGWPIVYDCMDHHASFSTNDRAMLDQEPELLSSADLVVVSSDGLQAHAQQANRNVLLIRNACDYDHFASASLSTASVSNRIKKDRGAADTTVNTGRPTVGYYGAIADWFDSDLVADLAERRTDWDFVLVGSTFSADTKRLSKLENVSLPGEKHYGEVPAWLRKFDVVIIPFKRTPLTESTNPVKAYEILAAGKPVVSVPIPEMRALSQFVRLASNAKEFETQISLALTGDEPESVRARQLFAEENTWEKRYQALAPAVRDVFPKASIVIVTYNNLELNRLCMESIYARTEWPNFEVIVVDNNSTDGSQEYLSEAENNFANLRVILNETNLGFAAANNIGLREADGNYLVLLNNDTIVPRGWLSTLIRHLQADPSIGLIGPVTNTVGNEAKVDVDYDSPADMPAWAARFVREHDGQVFSIPMLAMFCVALRREVFDKVGLLDEQFGIGMFEDDDYTHRVKAQGFRVVCAADAFVHHFGQAAFKKLIADGKYQALFDENRRRYEQKWNIEWVPHQYAQPDK